jgi:hypothetical protein
MTTEGIEPIFGNPERTELKWWIAGKEHEHLACVCPSLHRRDACDPFSCIRRPGIDAFDEMRFDLKHQSNSAKF